MIGWQLITWFDGDACIIVQHVMPIDDLREHTEDPACFCAPTEDADTAGLWVHHALDQRERYENEELKPQ